MSAMLHTRAVTPPPSSHPPGDNLAPGDIEDLAAELVAYHAHFAPLFRRAEQRHWARQYLAGQLLDLERKSIEPMALALAGGNVQALQQFISVGAWDDEAILQRHQELVAETLGDPATGVLIIDGCDFPKQGRESVGVARQWCGAQGKIANCQASVVACYASARGYTLVDRRLYRLWHAFRAGEWADLADSIAIPRHSGRLNEGEAMELATLLPHFADVRITRAEFLPDGVIVEARVRAAGAPCPDCHRRSRRVHSRYTRTLADQPIGERRVTVHLQVRRGQCAARTARAGPSRSSRGGWPRAMPGEAFRWKAACVTSASPWAGVPGRASPTGTV